MHPDNLACLTVIRPDACALANNQILDFGRRGLIDTLEALSGAEIKHVGAGLDSEHAKRPAIVTLPNGHHVVIASGGTESSGIPRRWAATVARPGVAFIPNLFNRTAAEIADRVLALKQPGDITIVSLHWGSNWGYDVAPSQVRFARRLIDAGVDLVHGHSSHHPRSIEWWSQNGPRRRVTASFAMARVKQDLRESPAAAGLLARIGEDRTYMTLPISGRGVQEPLKPVEDPEAVCDPHVAGACTAEPVHKTSLADACAESASVVPRDDHRGVLVDRLMPMMRPDEMSSTSEYTSAPHATVYRIRLFEKTGGSNPVRGHGNAPQPRGQCRDRRSFVTAEPKDQPRLGLPTEAARAFGHPSW